VQGAVLENAAKLEQCDLLCYTYDSADPDSFAHVAELRSKHDPAVLDSIPGVFVALKADLDKAVQRCASQPDEYTASLGIAAPLHTSVRWGSISELFATVSDHLIENLDH